MITPNPKSKMFRSMSICPESMMSTERSRSPSPEPIMRSASVSSPPMSRVQSPCMVRRLEKICETPPPSPVVVEEIKKEKIMAPPMQYDLHKADAAFVYSHIKELTKNDVVATEYLERIKPAMFANQKPIVFGYIPAPPIEQIVKQVIGAKGYFFKMTTVVAGVHFIWHDTEANMFLFWGPSTFKVVKAMNSIRWRIFKYCEEYNAQQPAEIVYDANDDTDDDMPALVSIDDCEPISQGSAPDYEHPEQN
jgi:hypothetical protein